MNGTGRPIVGITCDLAVASDRLRVECSAAYAHAVEAAGGVPVLLPPMVSQAHHHAAIFHAFVLTGGDDPRTEPFGEPTHAKAKPVHPDRQAYETALLDAIRARHTPTLGICLGMQLMALHAGGRLDQHLPDTLPSAGRHWGKLHSILPQPSSGPNDRLPPALSVPSGVVHSHHRQAVVHPGSLVVLARSEDGVIEAIADPCRPFYLGVQWHPERTADHSLGAAMFERLIGAALLDGTPRG